MSFRKAWGALALAAAVAIGATGCSTGGQEPAENLTLTLGTIGDTASFDPAQSEVGWVLQFLQPAYDTLIRIDDKGELQPMLATSWNYTDDENKVLELKLRDDVTFSDGSPFDAEAVVASLKRFAAANGPRASALASVASYDAPDATTVVLTLSAPDPALVHNFGLVAGMITNPAVADGDLAQVPAGTGPYVLDEDASRRGDTYVFTRNEKYYDPEAFPYAEIDLKVLTDPTARLNAVKTGQVDATWGIPPQVNEAKSAGLQVLPSPGDFQGLFLIDRKGQSIPALGDVRVRQAINYAIDGDALLKVAAYGEGTPTTQIFSPGTPAYDDALDDAYPFDPDKARELLAEAGYADGFTISMPSTDAFLADAYPIVKQQLGDVGITVNLVPFDISSGFGTFLSGEYPAYVFSWGSSQNWLDASLLLSADGAWNPFHVDDPEIADLMSQIALASGDEQDALYKKLSAYVVGQAWFDPWYVNNNLVFAGSEVTVTPQPQQSAPSIYNFSPAN